MVWLDEGGRGRNQARLLEPPPSLAPWVEHFWMQEAHRPAESRPWRIVPDGSAHIVFAAGDRVRCAVVGARETYSDADVARRKLTLGVRLRLGALAQLTRSRADVFTGRAMGVEDVFGKRGRNLGDRMRESTPHAALLHLAAFLQQQLAACEPDLKFENAVRSAGSVASLAHALGASPRSVYARATEGTGLGPRRLLRILRLHRALERAADAPVRWSEIAHAHGFADQAHMVREFQSLLGDSPVAWHARRLIADSFNTHEAG